jgi:hypothetical protein
MTLHKGPATESTLGDLHSKVAKVMVIAVDKMITAQENPKTDEEGNEVDVPISPALLSVITKFLDTNKITCAPEAGNTMSELEQKLAEKRSRRRKVGNFTVIESDDD